MTNQRITALLDDLRLLDPQRYELVQALRKQILDLDSSVTEEVKYGGILFSTQQAFCGIFSYTKHVSLEFGQGASLPDPWTSLEGEGKFRRHIKLLSAQDIIDKHVDEYLRLALKAGE